MSLLRSVLTSALKSELMQVSAAIHVPARRSPTLFRPISPIFVIFAQSAQIKATCWIILFWRFSLLRPETTDHRTTHLLRQRIVKYLNRDRRLIII